MLTVLYVTNRGPHPMRRLPLGQYDLLAVSLASQVDEDSRPFRDYELIVVDRENTLPRREVELACREANGGVRFLRPRATPWTRLGAFAPNAARNTGLCAARGTTVVGLDDCFALSSCYLWRCSRLADLGFSCAALLRQADASVAYPVRPVGPVADADPIGGLCSYPLGAAVKVNGWDERFDGCSGGDVDFTWRLRLAGARFVRHQDVVATGHDHAGRTAPHHRCDHVASALGAARRDAGRLRGNEPWTEAELASWRDCGRGAECRYTGFPCDAPVDDARALSIMTEYETRPWFDLESARGAEEMR